MRPANAAGVGAILGGEKMSFIVHALPEAPFAPYFSMPEEELLAHRARVMVADASPGFPCRVSLADAEVGERVLLIHHEHHACESPFRSSHAICVREGAEQALMRPGELPEMLRSRTLSLRVFDADSMLRTADIVEGEQLEPAIRTALRDPAVAYLHLHNVELGCYLARVTRA
jgi:hypothetical protein